MKHPITEDDLVRQLHSLPQEISPEKDSWDAIAQRIHSGSGAHTQRGARTSFVRFAMAAGVVVALGVGLVVNLLPPAGVPVSAPETAAQMPDARAKRDMYQAGPGVLSELEYQAAFREFLALDSVPVEWQPQSSIPLDFGWETTRQAEIALIEALRRDPGNQFLKERLSTLRARQLELLQTIAAVEMASRRNTI